MTVPAADSSTVRRDQPRQVEVIEHRVTQAIVASDARLRRKQHLPVCSGMPQLPGCKCSAIMLIHDLDMRTDAVILELSFVCSCRCVFGTSCCRSARTTGRGRYLTRGRFQVPASSWTGNYWGKSCLCCSAIDTDIRLPQFIPRLQARTNFHSGDSQCSLT